MSGGSYGYLYAHAPSKAAELVANLTPMAERLRELRPHALATLRTSTLLRFLTAAEGDLEALADVFQALEWFDSSDWNIEQVDRVIERYENG